MMGNGGGAIAQCLLRLVCSRAALLLDDPLVCRGRVLRLARAADEPALDGYEPGLGENARDVEPGGWCRPLPAPTQYPEGQGYKYDRYGDGDPGGDGCMAVVANSVHTARAWGCSRCGGRHKRRGVRGYLCFDVIACGGGARGGCLLPICRARTNRGRRRGWYGFGFFAR